MALRRGRRGAGRGSGKRWEPPEGGRGKMARIKMPCAPGTTAFKAAIVLG